MPFFGSRNSQYIRRYFLAAALLAPIVGCASRTDPDNCDFSRFGATEALPEQVIDENTHYNRKTHWAASFQYPKEARANRIEGEVQVRVLIDSKGGVVEACAITPAGQSRPNASLADAAVSYVKQWKFRPSEGDPANLRQSVVKINFSLASP
jgi:TonB family protein